MRVGFVLIGQFVHHRVRKSSNVFVRAAALVCLSVDVGQVVRKVARDDVEISLVSKRIRPTSCWRIGNCRGARSMVRPV